MLYKKDSMANLLLWDVYEFISPQDLQGVKLRGRIHKYALEKGFNILVENDEKNKKCIRAAVLSGKSENDFNFQNLLLYLKNLDLDIEMTIVLEKVANPVLSKLRVNDESLYEI